MKGSKAGTIMEVEEVNRKQNLQRETFASCSFSSLGLHSTLCDELQKRMGFEAPTHVQAQAIPVILSGRHILVNAATGTGKTVTYLAPIIHHLQSYSPRITRAHGTFALVIVPTHELCMQVHETLQNLLHRFHWIVPGYIMGSENRSKEKSRLRKGISILIATPGRLLDHLRNTKSFIYTNLRWIIFDEADKILEQGFGKVIEEILGLLGSRKNEPVGKGNVVFEHRRQNLLLSATLNEKVNHLANISLENPVMIGLNDKMMQLNPSPDHVGSDVDNQSIIKSSSSVDYKLPSQLVQKYVEVPCGLRLSILLLILQDLFERDSSQKIVVFFSTRDAVDFHYSLLSEFHWPPHSPESELKQLFLKCKTFRLHGNMNQEDRRTTFGAFKTEKLALLLCTDIAARGLDFPKVRCIVQYDSPGEATEYVHRVGRTARLGERGESLLFLQPVELDYLEVLETKGVTLTEYPVIKMLDKFPLPCAKKRVLSVEFHPWVMSLHRELESFISREPIIMDLAKSAYHKWLCAYTTRRNELRNKFVLKKLHFGHVAKSFGLRDTPSVLTKILSKRNKVHPTRRTELRGKSALKKLHFGFRDSASSLGTCLKKNFAKRKGDQNLLGQSKRNKVARKTARDNMQNI